MSQPTPYVPATSFFAVELAQPQFPGQEIDVELSKLRTTTDEILANLARIQRDDTALKNESVGIDQLSPIVKARLGFETTIEEIVAELHLTPGVDVQAYDATLAALAGLTTGADEMIYSTGVDAFETTELSAFARTLLDDASAAVMRGTLNVPEIGGAATFSTLSLSGQLTSTVADGTPPFVVTSTTQVANLTAASAGTSTNATISDDTTTNATMFPVWVTAGSGGLPLKVTSSKLMFNPSTGTLTATKFAGALNGTVGATTPAAGVFTTLLLGGDPTLALQAATKQYVDQRHAIVSITDPAYAAVGDDSTVNTTGIQAALTANAAVYVPPGTYLTGNLTIPTTLKYLFGPGTLKFTGSNGFTGFLRAQDTTSLRVSGLTLDVNSTSYASKGVVDIVNGSNVTVDNCNFVQSGRFGVQIETGTNIQVLNNTFENYSQSAVDVTTGGNVKVVGNKLSAPVGFLVGPSTIGINFSGGNDAIIAYNYTSGSKLWGIHVGDTLRAHIFGNNVQDSGAEGITVGGASDYCIVDNNNVSWGGTVSTDFGISVQGTDSSNRARYTRITNNRVYNCAQAGIAVAANTHYTLIDGNYLLDVARAADADQGNGVVMDGPDAAHTTVKGNTIVSTTGSNIICGVKELTGGVDYTLVDNNTIVGQSGTDIVLVGTHSKKLISFDTSSGVPTGNVTFGGNVSANVLTSTVAIGTAPFTVTSTTQVTNLNAAQAGTSTNANISDDTTTNATMFPTWVTAGSGGLPVKVTSSKLTFNPSTGTLTATKFSGALNGTVGATTPATGAFTTVSASGVITSTVSTGTAPFTVASTTQVTNLNAAQAGTSTNATVTDDTTTNATMFPTWVTAAGGVPLKATSSKLTFNPSTGVLSSTSFTGAGTGLTGTAASLTAGLATALVNARTIGGVSFNGSANITVSTATAGFTVSGGDLALGTNNVTMTGSIGATGSRVTKGWFTDLQVTNAIAGSITGNAATVTTNANLTGDVTSSGNATTIGATKVTSAMLNSDVFSTAHSWGGIQTLSTPVFTGLPTGTGVATANTVSTLVARDGSGNFSAGVITATSLTGKFTTARTIGGVSFDGSANITVASATGGFAVSGGSFTHTQAAAVGTITSSTGTNAAYWSWTNTGGGLFVGVESSTSSVFGAGAYSSVLATTSTPIEMRIGGATRLGVTATAVSVTGDFSVTGAIAASGPFGAWTTQSSPTVSAGSGTITTASAASKYWQIGKTVVVSGTITVTTNGSGSNNLRVSLPSTAAGPSAGVGQNTSVGFPVIGNIVSGSSVLILVKSDGTGYPVSGDGQTVNYCATYEST